MKISIHQPQYLPWVPYFLKIAQSDLFVFLDTVSFQKNGLQNRNKIKTPQGAEWLTVPVQQKLGTPINEVKLVKGNWQKNHVKSLQSNYGRAKNFERFFPEIEKLYSGEWDRLSQLNIEITLMMMRWLGIKTPVKLASQLGAQGKASDLILDICQILEADTYFSGHGGKNYLKEADFEAHNIHIEYFVSEDSAEYHQLFPKVSFIPDLSAIDIIFNCGESWSNYFDSRKKILS